MRFVAKCLKKEEYLKGSGSKIMNREGTYDTAQVCKNGHGINASFHDYPDLNLDFCKDCGEKTIIKCDNCDAEIQGTIREITLIAEYVPPDYCGGCGEPFPWTQRRIETATSLIEEFKELEPDDRELLYDALPDLIRDTPKTELASKRFKRILGKLGTESYEIAKSVLVNVLSEAAKKSIF